MKSLTLFVIAIVLLAGAGFFLFKVTGKTISVDSGSGEIKDIVLGMKDFNYYPQNIKAKVGERIRIHLDSSVTGCLRSFTLKDFGVSKYLKSPEDYVEFTPLKPGSYSFSCSMGMAYGKLVVE